MGMLPPVLIELKALAGGLKTSIGEAKGELTSLEATGNARMQGLANAGKIAAVGIAVAGLAIAGASTKLAVDYQSSMATIQGSAQMTAPQVKLVGDAFLSTAGKSTFSAQEMSTALGPVAGVVKQLSGGTLTAGSSMQFMKAATDAAEASGLSLSSTTHDLSAVMLAYGLKTKDAGEASNQLFNTSRLTGVGLDALSGVMAKLHGKLGEVSPTLADTGGLLVDLAQHGVSGSRGVMIANTALQTLLGGSKATGAELKTLGAHVYDSNGKFVGMQSILAQLTPKLAGMTDQQRHAAEAALFGKGAAEGLNSTILAGVAGFTKAKDAVAKKGAVDAAAATQAATLKGQMHLVAASAEDLGVKFGTLLIPMIQKAITVIGSIVTWLIQHKAVAIALAGVIGGVLVTAITAWGVMSAVNAAKQVASAVAVVGAWAAQGAAALASGATMAAVWLSEQADAIAATATSVAQFAIHAAQWVASGVVAMANAAVHAAAWLVSSAGAVAATVVSVAQFVIQGAKWVGMGVIAMANAAVIAAAWLISMGPIAIVIAAVIALGVLIATHMDQIKGWIGGAWNWVKDTTSSVWGAVVSFFQGIPGKVSAAIQTVIDFVKKVFSYTPLGLVITNFGAIVSFFAGIPGKILGALGNLGGLLLSAGGDLLRGLASGITGAIGDVINAAKNAASAAIKAVKGVLGIQSPSTVFAEVGKNTVLGMVLGIEGSKGALAASMASLVAVPRITPLGGLAAVGGVSGASLSALGGTTTPRSSRPGGGTSSGATSADIAALGDRIDKLIQALPKAYQTIQRKTGSAR